MDLQTEVMTNGVFYLLPKELLYLPGEDNRDRYLRDDLRDLNKRRRTRYTTDDVQIVKTTVKRAKVTYTLDLALRLGASGLFIEPPPAAEKLELYIIARSGAVKRAVRYLLSREEELLVWTSTIAESCRRLSSEALMDAGQLRRSWDLLIGYYGAWPRPDISVQTAILTGQQGTAGDTKVASRTAPDTSK